MSAPIVAMDTETSGLHPLLDEIWEFAGIRREPSGIESELHLFIEHNPARCILLPDYFRNDHVARYRPDMAVRRDEAAQLIHAFLAGPAGSDKAHVIGAVPNFDTERLTLLLGRCLGGEWKAPWHYHLCDVENLAVGYLRAQHPDVRRDPPWNSDELADALGVEISEEERHTALGDAKFALRIYDTIMGGTP